MSVSPPGGAATTMRTDREGYCSAVALPATQHDARARTHPKARPKTRNIRFLLARRFSRFIQMLSPLRIADSAKMLVASHSFAGDVRVAHGAQPAIVWNNYEWYRPRRYGRRHDRGERRPRPVDVVRAGEGRCACRAGGAGDRSAGR